MDLTALKDLLPALVASRVLRLKLDGVEIEFQSHGADKPFAPPTSTPSELQEMPEPADMPPDLKADDLMNYDKVLHWSGSQDGADPEPMPLTDEAPLGDA